MLPNEPTTPMQPPPPITRFTYAAGQGAHLPTIAALWQRGSGARIAVVAGGVFLTMLLCCGSLVSWATSPEGQRFSAMVNATNTATSANATAYAIAHPKPTDTPQPTVAPKTPTATTLPGVPTITLGTPIPDATVSATRPPTATSAPQATNTPISVPPTSTSVPVQPTNTPIPAPTATQPPPPPTNTPVPPNTCGAPANPYGYNFCGGNYIYNPPGDICNYLNCIASFWKSTNGYVDECNDGTYSHSGGVQGACSKHGGEWRPLYGP